MSKQCVYPERFYPEMVVLYSGDIFLDIPDFNVRTVV
jgi:hypothetical protein